MEGGREVGWLDGTGYVGVKWFGWVADVVAHWAWDGVMVMRLTVRRPSENVPTNFVIVMGHTPILSRECYGRWGSIFRMLG